MDTTERLDQLAWGCSILTKKPWVRIFWNAVVIKSLSKESFAALMVLPSSNPD